MRCGLFSEKNSDMHKWHKSFWLITQINEMHYEFHVSQNDGRVAGVGVWAHGCRDASQMKGTLSIIPYPLPKRIMPLKRDDLMDPHTHRFGWLVFIGIGSRGETLRRKINMSGNKFRASR